MKKHYDSSNIFQPQLMTKEQLFEILNERQPNIPNLIDLSKDDLVKIYNKFVLPLPQRQPKRNQPETTIKNLVTPNSIDCSASTGKHKRISATYNDDSNKIIAITNGKRPKLVPECDKPNNAISQTKRPIESPAPNGVLSAALNKRKKIEWP